MSVLYNAEQILQGFLMDRGKCKPCFPWFILLLLSELAGETGERDQDRLPAEQAGIFLKMAFVTWQAVIGSWLSCLWLAPDLLHVLGCMLKWQRIGTDHA